MQQGNYALYPSLFERVVIVTGGASGIGECIVQAFAEQSAHVAFLAFDVQAGHSLVERIAAARYRRPAFYAAI